ncbi:hydrolase [Dactylosporangium sp. NBC_01737]|uniref:alpha/beta hydrolase family protein n=1 Tax=Dactylosporangium sp. NBC_01737 TaxID=2975959 RepID=UPI002E119A95|nr:hydrolase [Dactylosporangium sp. NBC_01737]
MHPLALSRRRLLGAATIGTALTLFPALPAAAARGTRPAFRLPAPTGPHPIGTVPLHLVDPSRTDPWVTPARPRELMIQLWYPTARPAGPPAPWLTQAEAGPVGRDLAETVSGVPRDLPGLAEVRTHAHTGAPLAARQGGWPVVLFSPGFGAERNSSAALVEDLASRGHVVVTVDHTHDPLAVEFPGGRVEPNTIMALIAQIEDPAQFDAFAAKMVAVRSADLRFVLDRLAILDAGGNPDVEHRRLPAGTRGSLRLTRVGAFGHSLGGATAAQAMHDDRRIRAGINLDGALYGADAATGLDRPFLLFAAGDTDRGNTPGWGAFADHLRGWHRELRMPDARHLSFHDSVLMVPTLAALPGAQTIDAYGTIDGPRVVAVARAHVGAFFDLHLRGVGSALLDAASPRYPEIRFVA